MKSGERCFQEGQEGNGRPWRLRSGLRRAYSQPHARAGLAAPDTQRRRETEEEEREAPTPTLGEETASATPNPHHIPSLSATKKRRPFDPRGAPAPNPRGRQGGGGPPRGVWGVLGDPIQLPSAQCIPFPNEGGGRAGRMEGRGRRGHSRLERVLNGGGHGPLGWAASGSGRRCRRARAQPGLRRPLCRPAR